MATEVEIPDGFISVNDSLPQRGAQVEWLGQCKMMDKTVTVCHTFAIFSDRAPKIDWCEYTHWRPLPTMEGE